MMQRLTGRFVFFATMLLATASASALDQVTLQLKWTHAFQFAGYYAAKEQGYYREAGLDVSILEAAPDTDPVHNVLEGKVQFGVGTSNLLLERAAGKPVVALAVVFQQSPYEIYAAANIHSLRELVGKRIMLEPQSGELLVYLKKEGIPTDNILQMTHSFDVAGLMAGKADAISGYISNEPYYFRQAKYAYHTFSPRSAGINFYGDNLFTSARELRAHPERVKQFRAASLRGWQYAKDHRDEVIELILSKYPTQHKREYLRFESEQMIPLLQPNLIEIGYMSPNRWRDIASTYADIGLLQRDFSVEGFLYDESEPDLTWFYRGLAAALIIMLIMVAIAAYIYRLNLKFQANEKRLLLAASVFTHAHEGIMITEPDGTIIDVNDTFCSITGYSRDEALGHTPNILHSGRQGKEYYAALWRDLTEKGYWYGEVWNRRKNGEVFAEMQTISAVRDAQGNIRQYVSLFSDITERKAMEEQVYLLAFYDPLTRLPNRRLLNDRLAQAMTASKRSGRYGALMFLDLDNFKPLNDTHGHAVGDLLLSEAAARLKSSVRESDSVGRFGGDEFIVMLSDLSVDKTESYAQSRNIAEKIRVILAEPYRLTVRSDGKADTTVEHHCTASIGVVLFIHHECSQADIMARADAAMYQAKEAGRNLIRFYAPEV